MVSAMVVARRMGRWRHRRDTWILMVMRWLLARKRDIGNDELSTAFSNDTVVASSSIRSAYFDYTQITIEFYPSLHKNPSSGFGLIPSLLSDMNAMFAIDNGTHSCLGHLLLLLRVGAIRSRLYCI